MNVMEMVKIQLQQALGQTGESIPDKTRVGLVRLTKYVILRNNGKSLKNL